MDRLIPSMFFNEPLVLTYMLIFCTTTAIIVFEYKKQKMLFKKGAQKAITGPAQIPVLGNLYQMTSPWRENRLTSSIKKYLQWAPQGVVRIYFYDRLFVFIGVPAYIETVLGNLTSPKKAEEYRIISESPIGGGLIAQPDVNVWRAHRKIITPTFHFNILKTYFPIFFEETTILIDRIKSKLGGESCHSIYVPDIKPFVQLSTFNMIMRSAFGVNIHAQQNQSHSFVNAMSEVTEVIQHRIVKPWLLLDVLFWLFGYKSRLDDLTKTVYKFTEEVIREKRREYQRKQSRPTHTDSHNYGETKHCNDISGSNDMGHSNNTQPVREDIINENVEHKASVLDENAVYHRSFIELIIENEDNEVEKMTDEEIRDNMVTIMFAGQDTTATTNCIALLMLALHPDIQSQVIEEIDSVFGGQGMDDGHATSHAEVMKLHTLERVIKETTRLYPAVPILARAIMEDTSIGPYILPKGCSVVIYALALHRDPDLHSKADEFWPDRFLPQNSHLIQRWSFIPFGGGSRNCVGQKYAMFQMKVVLSTILRRYRVSTDKNIRSLRDVDELVDLGITLNLERCPVMLTERFTSA